MPLKFSVIVADPPWDFSDRIDMINTPRGARANYNTMSMLEIKQMPVKEVSDPSGAILALWVPSSLLQEGLDTMSAWGFKHKQTYIWIKNKKNPFDQFNHYFFKNMKNLFKEKTVDKTFFINVKKLFNESIVNFSLNNTLCFGMGRLFRQTHEICLIGTNNNKIYKKLNNKSQRSVSFGNNLKHSAKPEYLQDSLEIMFPDSNKLELFARRDKTGWTCLGNECPSSFGKDIVLSLNEIMKL